MVYAKTVVYENGIDVCRINDSITFCTLAELQQMNEDDLLDRLDCIIPSDADMVDVIREPSKIIIDFVMGYRSGHVDITA